jgi:hypothetical protein
MRPGEGLVAPVRPGFGFRTVFARKHSEGAGYVVRGREAHGRPG